MNNSGVRITWLGHSTFKITTAADREMIVDPWVYNNPACPGELKKFDQLDLMLITHGHFDHIADAVELCRRYQPKTIAIFETGHWLIGKGVSDKTVVTMNKGGTVDEDGIKITMVHADHSCGILDDGRIIYGGDPCGFVVEFENGFKVYHAGDTNVFGDMKLIGELYSPDLAILPIGGHYTMSPYEAARAIRLLGVNRVIPMHFNTFPVLKGTPAELRELAGKDVEVIELKPGESFEQTAPGKLGAAGE